MKCKDHPDAPHGFDRNGSHSEDRYVCMCEHWEPEPLESSLKPSEAILSDPGYLEYLQAKKTPVEHFNKYELALKEALVLLNDMRTYAEKHEVKDYLYDTYDPVLDRIERILDGV